ncbi:hypothetical protein C7271_09860 [filamentous cyanobacterium CCP5]|nr:hypothetical protein C7271_09860 [filamentous cyanobacterium CCP5]
MSQTPSIQLCPCSSGDFFSACCQPYLQGTTLPSTAEALMRSRYSAFCTGNLDYLIATHHPSQRSPDERLQLAQTIKSTEWLGLRIVSTHQGLPSDQIGIVEFVAVYRAGQMGQIHERSRFGRHRGGWIYLEGDQLPPLWPKRNQPCWCGSGQKFKQCHGRAK